LITRAGTIELRVPRDRTGLFSIELFERYQRSELCGHSFSASAISGMNRTLDAALTAFASRRLKEPYAYLILDARYERVRESGAIASQAVLVAVAVDGEGRRQILGVDLANRESTELAGVSAATAAARPASRGVCGV
jgi:putative transposase